jgi:hypothetical protein
MSNELRKPGWDKIEITRIANEHYSTWSEMFSIHDWSNDGKPENQIAATRIVETYGSVEKFVDMHDGGRAANPFLTPHAALEAQPNDVWLTSFYGFGPETWAMFGFTKEADRKGFLDVSQPGALVVVYGTKGLPKADAGKVLGVLQVSHLCGPGEAFVAHSEWAKKMEEFPEKWNYGVQVTRAWKIPEDCRPAIEDFAPATYSHGKAQAIGRYGSRLAREETQKLLGLIFEEVPVFNRPTLPSTIPATGAEAFNPSRPGPVSRNPYLVKESEGPKHLYILQMTGPTEHFIHEGAGSGEIIKVGFSVSPITRQKAFIAALPGNRIAWKILHSTFNEGREPFPTSAAALAGEKAMVDLFFLASADAIAKAWAIGNQMAREHKL